MGDELPPLGDGQHRFAEGGERMQHGAVGLERLFQRRGDDLLAPLGLEDPAFAVFRFQRHDGRDAHLGGFFQKPLETLRILGRRDGHRQRVRQFFEPGFGADDPHGATPGIVVGDFATK